MPSEHAQLLPPGAFTGVGEARAAREGANVTGTAHPPPPFAPLRQRHPDRFESLGSCASLEHWHQSSWFPDDLPHNASCSMRYSVAERIMPSEHAQLLPPGVSTGVREARAEGGGANVTGTAHPPPPFAPLR
eukprot:CAMPEP_0113240958 /NCGR_PEP_ID=MMETSP0008_2-20120614/6540_1 /TAXON_ID=97485 /ORGANISM="Prymnesium parvum" /LENGTH=131 /DNA_ID=CAMNT_0000088333 /DNA_START=925 /DNA_END=1318 /DNA_ORIENTATION=- /assembly_acc=CAM_ASM_000153